MSAQDQFTENFNSLKQMFGIGSQTGGRKKRTSTKKARKSKGKKGKKGSKSRKSRK
jgi:hypothetical protein